ncbi:Predicted transcriptional regulator [Anaerocolumna jejuensis DSM 15929]|uniref:Predicted transcriptional regulator n=1 Tax=Anaerocolumna jejuensis DSM 15929 TaxID=1121322 RepID=A0A1M6W507_9FIRM|nr:BlaI/MecI/CopY family transcriptional regulator [Anaerocolumna jejuensis]SHK88832.1 Predicted transcriptional regulator [Anaerocolumna jejuensis DSM 15929]
MKKIQRISDSEKQIMEFIWSTGKPVTTKEIMEHLPQGTNWKQSTVITFLARLLEKGLIRATRISKANYYEPAITEREYKEFETKQFIKDVHKGSVFGLISALCDSGDLTREDIEKLMNRLKE